MEKRSAHKHDVARDILLLIHSGNLLAPTMFDPDRIRQTLYKYWRLQRHSPAQLRRSLKYLTARGLVRVREDDEWKSFVLTERGQRKVSHFELEEAGIPIPLTWDRKWRIVLFDVPESKKSARNALSLRLRAMGLLKLQDSVWVHPFPCEDQVTALRHALDLSDHVRVVVAERLENDALLREHFHLA